MSNDETVRLNIKKKKSNRPIYFGVRPSTGELLSVSDVTRGLACDCVCPACNTRLEARKGEIRTHHFAHEINKECLYGAEISVYHALFELLKKQKRLFLPPAILTFQSNKKPEVISPGRNIVLTDVKFTNGPVNYPPELLCYADTNCFQIILNIEHYYSKDDYQLIREAGKQRNIAIVRIDIDDLDSIAAMRDVQHLIEESDNKNWIYNRAVERWDHQYQTIACEPARFESGHLCLAQKYRFKNVYSARREDCVSCEYCYDCHSDKFCLAPSFISHISDFKRSEEERKQSFIEKNNIRPFKKIGEYNCPRCGAPLRRRNGPNGVFAGCSNYPQCRGSRQVEPTTEQVIIPERKTLHIGKKNSLREQPVEAQPAISLTDPCNERYSGLLKKTCRSVSEILDEDYDQENYLIYDMVGFRRVKCSKCGRVKLEKEIATLATCNKGICTACQSTTASEKNKS